MEDDAWRSSPSGSQPGEAAAAPGMSEAVLPVPTKGACRVPGCTQRLLQPYNQRHRICRLHQKAAAIEFEGLQWRFCQQCAKLQTTDCFEGDKRSCVASLLQQKQRRQRHGGGVRLSAATSAAADDAAGECEPRSKRRRSASLSLLQQLDEEEEEEEEEADASEEAEEGREPSRQRRQQAPPRPAAAWAPQPPQPQPAPAARDPLEAWVRQQAEQAAQQAHHQQRQQQQQQQQQWPVRPAGGFVPVGPQPQAPAGGPVDALLAIDGLNRRMEKLESQVELILQLLQGETPQLPVAAAAPQAVMPPPPPQARQAPQQAPPAPPQQQQVQQAQQAQHIALLGSLGLPSGLLSLPLPVGAAPSGQAKVPLGDEAASTLMLRAAAELLQRSGEFPGSASEDILALAGELGLLSALQADQLPAAAQQPAAQVLPAAQQAAAPPAQAPPVAQQAAEAAAAVLPPRVRLPSPTIARPPPATAAAASLCTRGLGKKPLVLGGSLAGSAGPAGSSNSGDVRPAGSHSGRSANRSAVPNPFTAFAVAGGSPDPPGHELLQENGSNPVWPAVGPEGGQARRSASPALPVQQRMEGLQSLLQLMAGGSAS